MTLGTTADWMHIARDTAHSQLRAKSQLLCIGWRKLKTSLATTTTLTAYGSWWRRIMTGGVWCYRALPDQPYIRLQCQYANGEMLINATRIATDTEIAGKEKELLSLCNLNRV